MQRLSASVRTRDKVGATVSVQARADGALECGGDGKWSDAGCVLKVESAGPSDRTNEVETSLR